MTRLCIAGFGYNDISIENGIINDERFSSVINGQSLHTLNEQTNRLTQVVKTSYMGYEVHYSDDSLMNKDFSVIWGSLSHDKGFMIVTPLNLRGWIEIAPWHISLISDKCSDNVFEVNHLPGFDTLVYVKDAEEKAISRDAQNRLSIIKSSPNTAIDENTGKLYPAHRITLEQLGIQSIDEVIKNVVYSIPSSVKQNKNIQKWFNDFEHVLTMKHLVGIIYTLFPFSDIYLSEL